MRRTIHRACSINLLAAERLARRYPPRRPKRVWSETASSDRIRPNPSSHDSELRLFCHPTVLAHERIPHSREQRSCYAARTRNAASTCPSSLSLHAVRRGAITYWLSRDVPEKVVCEFGAETADWFYNEVLGVPPPCFDMECRLESIRVAVGDCESGIME